MAFGTVVQHLEYNDKAESLTVDWADGSTPVSGNLLIIFAGNRASATWSPPSGYTLAHKRETWAGSSSTQTYIWYKIASSSESNVTVDDGNSAAHLFITAAEVEGPWAASILGYVGSAEGTVAKATGLAPGTTGTLAQADNFVYSTLVYRGSALTTEDPTDASSTDGFSLASVIADVEVNNYTLSGAHFYKVTSATTALNPTHTWTMTATTSLLTVAQIAVFKKEAGGAAYPMPEAIQSYRQRRT